MAAMADEIACLSEVRGVEHTRVHRYIAPSEAFPRLASSRDLPHSGAYEELRRRSPSRDNDQVVTTTDPAP